MVVELWIDILVICCWIIDVQPAIQLYTVVLVEITAIVMIIFTDDQRWDVLLTQQRRASTRHQVHQLYTSSLL